jgi:hypothetical protein
MLGKGPKVVVAFAAILIAVLVGGCGSGSSTAETTSAEPADESSVPGSGAKSSAWNEINEELRGDILSFGETGSEAELEEAAEVASAYLDARSNEDGPRTCSYLSKYMLAVVEEGAKQSGKRGCVAGVEVLGELGSLDEVEEAGQIDPTSIRRRGKRAFVIYDDLYGDTYAMLMRPEGGTWTIQGFEATRLY